MKATMSPRLVRLIARPVAAAGVIGGATGMSAIAHMNRATPPAHQLAAPTSNR
jgi:hypothetical protein